MSRSDGYVHPALVFFCVVSMGLCGYAMGWMHGMSLAGDSYQSEAINHGAAEYYLDENNERQFRWLKEGE